MDGLAIASGPGGQMESRVFQDFRKTTMSMLKREQLYLDKTFPKGNKQQTSSSLAKKLVEATPEVNNNSAAISHAESSRWARYGGRMGSVFSGATVSKYMPFGQYGLGSAKYLSSSTQLAIVDYSKKIGSKCAWVFRIDKPHAGAKFDHINVNHAVTKLRDPHARLPSGTAAAAGALNKTMKIAGDVALAGAIVYDTYQVGSAAYSEVMEKGRPGIETGREVAAVAGTYGAGAVGAATGNTVGGWVGAGVGSLFGGAGAVPGAAVGSLVGGLGGGIYGALMGRTQGRSAVDAYFCKTKEESSPFSPALEEQETNNKSFSDKEL